jgi:hypothetical protein
MGTLEEEMLANRWEERISLKVIVLRDVTP